MALRRRPCTSSLGAPRTRTLQIAHIADLWSCIAPIPFHMSYHMNTTSEHLLSVFDNSIRNFKS